MLTKGSENTFYVNRLEPRTLKSIKEEKTAVSEHLLQSRPPVLLPRCPEDSRKKPALKSPSLGSVSATQSPVLSQAVSEAAGDLAKHE